MTAKDRYGPVIREARTVNESRGRWSREEWIADPSTWERAQWKLVLVSCLATLVALTAAGAWWDSHQEAAKRREFYHDCVWSFSHYSKHQAECRALKAEREGGTDG
jgi:hypothetical protein